MNFRATSFAIGSRAIQFSAKHNATILKYQEQIASGIRLQRPSQDPIAFRQVTSLKSRLTELAADKQSLSSVKSLLNTSSVQIQEFAGLINNAKTLTQQGVQAFDESEKNALALEVEGLLNQMKNLANSTFDGHYIYGGTKSDAPPFQFDMPASNGGTLGVSYTGSNKNSRAFVGEAVSVDTYYAGRNVFASRMRGETLIIGDTGIQSGVGTDTMNGRATLQVTHTETSYAGLSGIQPGTGSAERDTVLGERGTHTLTINDTSGDGSAGTISLNGSKPIAFTAGMTNLVVTGPSGEVVHVDTTNIAPGYSGTVDLFASGTVSIDGGKTETPIDFSADQHVEDSESGRFVSLDTSQVFRTGNDSMEFTGTSDAFQILYELTVDLRNERGLDPSDHADALNRRLGELDTVADHVFRTLGEQSTSLKALETLSYRIEDLELSVESQLSDIQSTNIPEAVLRMENSQALLQYTYAVTADISSLGLLEFLR